MVLRATMTLDNSKTTITVKTTKMNATKLNATMLDTARERRAEENRRSVAQRPRRLSSSFGFTLVELVLVVAVVMITAAFALPMTQSAIANYQLSGAVESATGIIQSTRYQAISNGYSYQVAFNASNNTYQVLSEVPPATSFSAVGSSVPLTGAPVVLNGSTTFQFKPDGLITAALGSMTFTISYNGTTRTVTVSRYGSVTAQ